MTAAFHFDGDEIVVTERPFLPNGRVVLPQVTCADGFRVSVQASEYHYCTPRETTSRYSSVEVGFPSERPEPWDKWSEYAEAVESPTDTVYGCVPAALVRDLIASHGGTP